MGATCMQIPHIRHIFSRNVMSENESGNHTSLINFSFHFFFSSQITWKCLKIHQFYVEECCLASTVCKSCNPSTKWHFRRVSQSWNSISTRATIQNSIWLKWQIVYSVVQTINRITFFSSHIPLHSHSRFPTTKFSIELYGCVCLRILIAASMLHFLLMHTVNMLWLYELNTHTIFPT